MRILCIHLESDVMQLHIEANIAHIIEVEFVEHILKKWPFLYCHIVEVEDDTDCQIA